VLLLVRAAVSGSGHSAMTTSAVTVVVSMCVADVYAAIVHCVVTAFYANRKQLALIRELIELPLRHPQVSHASRHLTCVLEHSL
jgi:uncharacterized NAD-dependent epimerase/dehydratase family protein